MSLEPEKSPDQKRRSARRLRRTLPTVAVLIALLVALFLVSGVQQDGSEISDSMLGDRYLWVLVMTLLALVYLLWTIASKLISLARRVRSEAPGALLAARWVRNFLIMSLPPALIVYFFSAYFLTNTIDNWFDVEVETALSDSLALGQEFLDTRTLEVRNNLLDISADLEILREEGDILRQALLSRVRASGPLELSVLETDGTFYATANINALTGLPARPDDFALLQVNDRGEYAAAEPGLDGVLQILVMVQMPPQYPGDSSRILQAIYPLPEDITALTDSIEKEYHRYQNVSYLRESLKRSYLLILTLVLLLTVLLAILAALKASRRMVAPLSRLSTATRDVAAGDFGRDVEAGEKDEIGFLLKSFNDMTQALKKASLSAEQSRAALQAQGDYLETVLGNLSSGVLTLDSQENIIRANTACRVILGLSEDYATAENPGETLSSLESTAPWLQAFILAIRRQHQRGKLTWQQEIKLQSESSALVLLARGSRLEPAHDTGDIDLRGLVIVFDDVTVLNQAQRDAAWSEVARRLAHEVKNPLTPIRLAAERLRMKLSGKLDPKDEEMLDRASNTIVSQVEALRTLVDAFGDYAREPDLSRSTIQLDDLIREVVMLYQQGDTDVNFNLRLCSGPEGLAADSGRLRQMLHNLIRNAKEACSDSPANITISSQVISVEKSHWLQLEVCDDGPGFPAAVLEKPFEPYVTSKSGGSGLGLAICRKIVAEHDGRIVIDNIETSGARVTILLPLAGLGSATGLA
jgi:nitrogen fixation/metabolism regulation signal transduction histidine kinase